MAPFSREAGMNRIRLKVIALFYLRFRVRRTLKRIRYLRKSVMFYFQKKVPTHSKITYRKIV